MEQGYKRSRKDHAKWLMSLAVENFALEGMYFTEKQVRRLVRKAYWKLWRSDVCIFLKNLVGWDREERR